MIPCASERITIPSTYRPVLTVVIDTEEEFDWSAPLRRDATGVRHMRDIARLQDVFDSCAIRPTYVVDYAIASQVDSVRPLKEFADGGRAVIGAHLHTWVSPPFEEEVSPRHSFQGNLPRELELAKLRMLSERIADSFGEWPVFFKAGRYGIGANTYSILEELAYRVDLSPAPPYDYSADGGPDFSRWTSDPFWIGQSRRLLCLPRTGAFVGWLGSFGTSVYAVATQLKRARVPGILARCNAVERLALSPEGFTLEELERLARSLVSRGLRILTLSLHSPSCAPGFTPYVRTAADLDAFVKRIRNFVEFFQKELNGTLKSVPEIERELTTKFPPGPAFSGG
jgi:uncharacterized protein Usg